MNRQIAVLALLSCVACYSKDPDLGKCSVVSDCTLPDGGTLPGTTCTAGLCQYSCPNICNLAETCVDATCVLVGPKITSVTAPQTWVKQSGTVTVTAVVDDTPSSGSTAPGIASAKLRIAGQSDIAGTTTDTGLVRTYTFVVPGSVQPTDSEAPVNFTVVATDQKGGTTPDPAAGSGQLRIDAKGPVVSGVVVNNGVAVSGIKWFKQTDATPFTAVATIQDSGSGLDQTTLTLMVGATRIDSGTPTCTGAAGAPLSCTFTLTPSGVPTSVVPSGGQRQLTFAVAGTDVAGNAVKTNTAGLGIDGKAPQITFSVGSSGTTTTYPAANADCNGGTVDPKTGVRGTGHNQPYSTNTQTNQYRSTNQ